MSDRIDALRACVERANAAATEREEKKARFLEFLNANLDGLSADLKALFLMQQMQQREIINEQAEAFLDDNVTVAIGHSPEYSEHLGYNGPNPFVGHESISAYRPVSSFDSIPETLQLVAMLFYLQPGNSNNNQAEIKTEVEKNHTVGRLEAILGEDHYARGVKIYKKLENTGWWVSGNAQCVLESYKLADMPQHFRENVPQELLSATPTLKKVLDRIEQDIELLKGHVNSAAGGQKK